MKFYISRSSDIFTTKKPIPNCKAGEKDKWGEIEYTIEINTLEELLALQKQVKSSLIIHSETIEIYDGYRE